MVQRITIVDSVYYEAQGAEPLQIKSGYSRMVVSDEQPYMRTLKVSQEYQILDSGWIKECGLLVIKNEEGSNPQKIPTVAEKEAIKGRIVELCDDHSKLCWLVHPGESLRACPISLVGLKLRCLSETAKVTLAVFPV